jgi:phosphoadenosine phosphosulfate reductase
MIKKNIEEQNLNFLIDNTNNILKWTFNKYPTKTFGTTSFGANGIVLLDLINKIKKDIPFYFINTGYHFKETIDVMKHFKKKGYNIIEIYPKVDDSKQILVEMGADLCCSINKVEPMREIIKNNKGKVWLSAVSRSQSTTRKNFRFLESQDYNIIKIAPMLVWKEDEIWRYIKSHKLVYNTLYDKGYKSIGCEPCTTIVEDGEDSRAGRWRGAGKEECGLHTQFNMK